MVAYKRPGHWIELSERLTCTSMARLKLIFFEDELIIYLLEVWEVKIGFSYEKR